MNSAPLFSVLICTVGKAELTRGAIDSIIEQKVRDVEIVVTDTSGSEVIKRLVESYKDPRVHFYEVPNLDPTISWEFAYEQSSGKYVLWYDDDNRLIPGALSLYRQWIEEVNADVISANHAYYFGEGNRHQPEYDNALSLILPYSGTIRTYERDDLLRAVYDFSMGIAPTRARWHSAATFVSRNICEQARKEVGYIIAPHMYGNFTLHPLIFWYAKKPVYVDRPLCIIGKFSSSITQQWSTSFVKVKRSTAAPYRFTGVGERSLGNTTAECYLRVRHDLPEHEKYPFNWSKFYKRYIRELLFLNVPFTRQLRARKEVWQAVERLSQEDRTVLRKQILFEGFEAPFLRVARTLGGTSLLKAGRSLLTPKTSLDRRLIPLTPYRINTIDGCARAFTKILTEKNLLP